MGKDIFIEVLRVWKINMISIGWNSLVLAITCALDPIYKVRRIEFIFRKLYPSKPIFELKMKMVEE